MTFEIFGRRISFFTSREQWDKAVILLKQYFLNPAVIFSAVLLLVWAALYIYASKKNKAKLRGCLRLISPIVYLFMILSLSVFNRTFGSTQPFHFKFDFVFDGTTGFHETRLAMAAFNFMYYIPYGALLSWSDLFRKKRYAICAIIATGFFTEALQSILGLGVGSIEHVIMYTLGGLCGIGIYIAVRSIKEKAATKT